MEEKTSSLRTLEQVIPPNLDAIKSQEDEINVWLEQEDIHWQQREKCDWYKLGNKIQSFFMPGP